jgi:hypothetical protein
VIILDTDVLSIVQRAEGPAYDRLAQRLDAADDDVAVSIISFEEQISGRFPVCALTTGPFDQPQRFQWLGLYSIRFCGADFWLLPSLPDCPDVIEQRPLRAEEVEEIHL